jgi:UDP-N-acetylmuramoyl-L-alanyl-D-glutamate--2,6-diaminopimelate ligase
LAQSQRRARRASPRRVAVINGNPSHDLNLVGITGTNGKTTTTYLTVSRWRKRRRKGGDADDGRISDRRQIASLPFARRRKRRTLTIFARGFRRKLPNGRHGNFLAGARSAPLRRLRFKVAIFTNLTRDHLDYHGTMENYFDAKKRLFDGRLGEKPTCCVVNIDDEWGIKLVAELKANKQKVVTFAQNSTADLTAKNIDVSLLKGTSFDLTTPRGNRRITSPLVGKPHVYNMLAATAAALELGYDLDEISEGLHVCVGAPGRFERVPTDGDFAVVVDYAHSDDALLNTLQTARELTKGKIITVFGCGGDRDRTKRQPMGEVAGENSDFVIVTSDNPRTENPLHIIEEIETGLRKTDCPFLTITDRREAIHRAIAKQNRTMSCSLRVKGTKLIRLSAARNFISMTGKSRARRWKN